MESPLDEQAAKESSLDTWSDEEVLAGTQVVMPFADDQRLSFLLQQQSEAKLTTTERSQLTALMSVYEGLLLKKAQSLREAVRRGLREPLAS